MAQLESAWMLIVFLLFFSAEVAARLNVVHKLGWDLTTKQMNILQSEGTAMSPLCENFGKDLIASLVANKSPFNRYLCNNMCYIMQGVASLLCGKNPLQKMHAS